ncbi:RluA family pseudouridine synthase [Corallococcus carmarthensis]|uniref:RNA pseudouridine synthase n=1 Tax=Corallococcus carmarthensis TaxID=2316728 RepID=A0A3A8KD89_9BACT|nr:RNA pseudouridine synthase [Corallococcus carmarthensis]NOK17458.1 RNA pseudouridine synthase [Corallococcus carmarthensis]RKH02181.1 RNA pseudouridine synthase [Corallococcus carmarthensis]
MSGDVPRVLFEGAGVMVVDKPAGVLVIPGREGGPSLRDTLEAQLGRKVYVVHRLDRDTSGALVFALDADVHRALSQAFEAGKVRKRYRALVEGRLEAPRMVDAPLVAGRKGRMRVAKPEEPDAKPSRTRVRPVETFARASLVEAEPLTGRTHQIRVHLLSLGHPLLVDHQYGREAPLTEADLGGQGTQEVLTRTPLHAARVEWPALPGVPARGVDAPLPPDMLRTLELLRAAG